MPMRLPSSASTEASSGDTQGVPDGRAAKVRLSRLKSTVFPPRFATFEFRQETTTNGLNFSCDPTLLLTLSFEFFS